MNSYRRIVSLTLLKTAPLLLLAQLGHSEVLELTSGDIINGELITIKEETIEWESPSLGDLTIDKDQIHSLNTKQELKFAGYDSPCIIHDLSKGTVYYQCGQAFSSISFLTLNSVAPFASAKQITDYSRGNLTLSGEDSDGNDINSDWTLEATYEKRKGDWRHRPSFRFNQNSETNDDIKVSNEQALLRYGINWFFRPNWFWTFDTQAEQDEKKELELRTENGFGMGYQFWQTKDSALSTELGVKFVEEQFEDIVLDDGSFIESPESNEYSSLSWTVNAFHSLHKGFLFSYEHKIDSSLENSEDWQAEIRAGLSITMGYGLSTELLSEWDYDNTPNEDLDKLDRKTSVGISYRW